jgi:hypothetical protein
MPALCPPSDLGPTVASSECLFPQSLPNETLVRFSRNPWSRRIAVWINPCGVGAAFVKESFLFWLPPFRNNEAQ